ncbi:MAG: hypothetical protein HY247_01435 [archaeon]|nr:MAG: hypothetical protein HY247_01435 [archaeon]
MRVLVLRRRGVSSVLGVLFLALVFLVAIGTQTYLSGLQAQSSRAQGQAAQRDSQRAREGIDFGGGPSSLSATNTGAATETEVAMIMKFENGTIYNLNQGSTPVFSPVSLTAGGRVLLQPLVPSGTCTPGTATCLSKFNSIVSGGAVPGRELGLVTSLGNVFWYQPSGGSLGQGSGQFFHIGTPQSTSATTWTAIAGLSFTGSANTFYEVELYLGYYQSVGASQGVFFSIGVPSGTTFLFCGGMFYSDPSFSTGGHAGEECTGGPSTSLGPTTNTQTTCIASVGACQFAGTAMVAFGATAGQFQVQFETTPGDTATVMADSTLIVNAAA